LQSSFGSVKLFGKIYEKDIIVHVDGSITKREKKKSKPLKSIYGHTPLSEKELDFLEEEKPEIVYVGTGYDAALPITGEAQAILANFNAIVMPTPEIVEKIEKEKRRMISIVHVTC
jgi:hypothetical protein